MMQAPQDPFTMHTTRRTFLKHAGAGTASVWLSALAPSRVWAFGSTRKPFDPRIKQHFLSVCRQCPAGCGVLAEVVEGKVKRLRGNPLHPTNRGTLCARGVSASQLYYNPDRIRTPLRRTGARGAGAWEPISWDAAYDVLSEKLLALRADGRSHTVALLAEELNGLERALAQRFCRAFGTPNFLDLSRHPTEDVVNAATVMQGLAGPVVFDIAQASFLVSFGVPFLESSRNPLHTWKQFAGFREGKRHARGRFVHISPTRDATAARADAWIPITPGTEGALALGMAYVIMQEGLYDHDFVNFHTQGFESWEADGEDFPGFHDHVRRHYKPARVAEITGVPVERIVGLAREFALARAPLALWQDEAGIAAQPLTTQMAIHTLNALVGNIDAPGGVLVPRTLPVEFAEAVVEDDVSQAGLAHGPLCAGEHTQFAVPDPIRTSFPDRVRLRSPYPIEALLIYRANPVFSELNGAAYRAALETVPFSACIAGFHNETTEMCDLILPESHALESWYAGMNYTEAGYPFFNVCEPVVPPRHDTAHAGDMLLQLARRCGGGVAASLPWASFQEATGAYITQLNEVRFGDMFGRPYQEIWTRLLERIGWRARGTLTTAAFWRACLKTGGWADPIYYYRDWTRALRTPSGRFEVLPTVLWTQLQRFRPEQAVTDAEKSRLLPHYPGAPAETPAYPFRLLVFSLPHLTRLESPNQPWLQEITGTYERQQWQAWVEMNPEDAHRLHLADGQAVRLESAHGTVPLPCRYHAGVQPGTVRVPFGLGHSAGGRWMKDIGVTPATVMTTAYDELSGTADWQRTAVRIRKV